MFYYYISILVIFFRLVNGQYLGFGGCATTVKSMVNFDPTQFVGEWYEAGRTFDISRAGSKCGSANVTIVNGVTNGTLLMYHREAAFLFNIPGEQFINAVPKGETPDGKYIVNTYILYGLVPYSYPLWILNTDYTTYAILWSCGEVIGLHGIYSWIWTRDRIPSESVLQTIYADLPNFGMDKNWFSLTDQGSCVAK